WLPGHNPPLLAVEVVSQDWRKDYAINPGRYADLGVRELVVFDPDAARTVGLPGAEGERTRVALQVYRSTPDDPTLVSVERGEGPAYCEVLQAWWVVTATDHGPRLRLARDGSPDQLVPLPTEALDRAERMLDEALDVRAQLAQQLDQERRAREHAQRQNRAIEQQRQEAEQRRQEAEQQRQEAERRSQADKQARQELERELDQLRALLAKHKHSEGS
ncbi:MAG: Uma2 family endonuclease, partial [Myxococcota bacterium]